MKNSPVIPSQSLVTSMIEGLRFGLNLPVDYRLASPSGVSRLIRNFLNSAKVQPDIARMEISRRDSSKFRNQPEIQLNNQRVLFPNIQNSRVICKDQSNPNISLLQISTEEILNNNPKHSQIQNFLNPKNAELKSQTVEDISLAKDQIKHLLDSSIVRDSLVINSNNHFVPAGDNQDSRKQPTKYLNVRQDQNQQKLELLYQSKSRGEQAFALELDLEGNLTLRVAVHSDYNWWLGQKQYLQAALKGLGYQTFNLQNE